MTVELLPPVTSVFVEDRRDRAIRGGVQCSTFAECLELAISGEDIDYQGLGGPYEFSDAGEPTAASYRVMTYAGGTEPDPSLDEFVLSR